MFLFVLLSIANAIETKPTLIVLQIEKQKETFKSFISYIEQQTKNVEIVTMDDKITFESFDEFNYHSVYILAPKYNFKQISKNTMKNFIAKGGNVFFAISQAANQNVKLFTKMFKVVLGNAENVIDKKVETIQSALFPSTEITYKGISMTIPTSDAFVPLIKYGFSETEDILAAAFQSTTNGRLAIIGSVEMFNNDNFETNKQFIQPLIQWILQLHGKLELKNVQITKLDGKPDIENEGMFFTNDIVSVTFEIEETMKGETKGYVSDDVQVEYRYVTPVILDYATNMKNGKYNFTTVLPDQFGVYTIRINYTRPLLTNLYFDQVTPIRPWRHDHVDRFQPQCYPFYLAFFLMSISTIIFIFFYLNYNDEKPDMKKD